VCGLVRVFYIYWSFVVGNVAALSPLLTFTFEVCFFAPLALSVSRVVYSQ
jgi:hypothetical protein